MRLPALIAVLIATVPATTSALDEQSCAAVTKSIDDRIATGNHPQQNVAIARQMRDSIAQSCSMLNQETIDQMLVGLDQLLPGANGTPPSAEKSKAERGAERAAQRAEADRRQAEREQRRAAARAKEEEKLALVSAAVRQPPQGKSLGGKAVDRADRMWGVTIVDWDLIEENTRVLYQTWPSRDQLGDSEASYHYYVVEVDREGEHTQSHVLSLSTSTTVTAGLLPGKDEIVVQRRAGDSASLQRWSIADGELLEESDVSVLERSISRPQDRSLFRLVTATGELLFAENVPLESGPNARTGVTWMLASADGDKLDQGFIDDAKSKIAMNDWFRSADGGAVLLLDVYPVDDAGIDSTLTLDSTAIGAVTVKPAIFSEQRMYFTKTKTSGAKQPSFLRRHMWLGLENVDQQAMISGESSRLTKESEKNKRLNDSTVYSAVAGRNRAAIVSYRHGAGVLLRNNDQDTEFPPQRGLWLEEYLADGKRRQTYLGLDAKHLGTSFDLLASGESDHIYIASHQAVLQLDGDRNVRSYARLNNDGNDIGVMLANRGTAWLFGIASSSAGGKQEDWVEQVQFEGGASRRPSD